MNDMVMFEDAYFDEKGAWFSASTHNGLYYWNFEEDTVHFMGMFPNEPAFKTRLFSKVVCYKSILVFLPYTANGIVEYDLINHKFLYNNLPDAVLKIFFVNSEETVNKYIDCVQVENILYIFSIEIKNIICYNITDKTIRIMTEWCDEVEKHIKDNAELSFGNVRLRNNKIIAPFWDNNKVFLFDVITEFVDVVKIGNDENEGFSNVELCDDGILLFSSKYSRVYKYTNCSSTWKIFEYNCDTEGSLYGVNSIWLDDTLYFFELLSGNLFCMDKHTSEISFIEHFPIMENIKKYYGKPSAYGNLRRKKDGSIIICPMGSDAIVEIKGKNILIKTILQLQNEKDTINSLMINKKDAIIEGGLASLTYYMKYLKIQNNDSKEHLSFSCGKEIYLKLARENHGGGVYA